MAEDEKGRCADGDDAICVRKDKGGIATATRVKRISGTIILLTLPSLMTKSRTHLSARITVAQVTVKDNVRVWVTPNVSFAVSVTV